MTRVEGLIWALALALVLWLSAPRLRAEPAPETGSDAPPSQDMLEFLADWETADGQWLDPLILETQDDTTQEQTQGDNPS